MGVCLAEAATTLYLDVVADNGIALLVDLPRRIRRQSVAVRVCLLVPDLVAVGNPRAADHSVVVASNSTT